MTSLDAGLLLAHTAATLAMTGLAWFVQLVHYPLYARVGERQFRAYERDHVRRTGWVVAPTMCLEAGAAAALALRWPAEPIVLSGLALVVLLWASTFLIQIPLHARLERGFDADAQRRLVATSWVRTAAWSARGALALLLLARCLAGAPTA